MKYEKPEIESIELLDNEMIIRCSEGQHVDPFDDWGDDDPGSSWEDPGSNEGESDDTGFD